ncbi:hypothetical protein B0H15DRAFT_440760 [Mycena belliarum]|uniref:Uncharacterized protein n=1 Tax=Mycena belliarum TaxID=1033014 RepID=A0AAD6XJ64_9AGAR|nr:hypothetical protein B0H15DRAFT_440760 [Mycena belliae]
METKIKTTEALTREAEDKASAIREQLSTALAETTSLREALQTCKTEISDKDDVLSKLSLANQRLEEENCALLEALDRREKERATLAQTMRAREGELHLLETQLENARRSCTPLNAHAGDTGASDLVPKEEENDALQVEHSALQTKVARLEEENRILREARDQHERERVESEALRKERSDLSAKAVAREEDNRIKLEARDKAHKNALAKTARAHVKELRALQAQHAVELEQLRATPARPDADTEIAKLRDTVQGHLMHITDLKVKVAEREEYAVKAKASLAKQRVEADTERARHLETYANLKRKHSRRRGNTTRP